MKRLNIEKAGLEFKNLLSGPAPIGRILNYIYFAGNSGLYHVNGYRSLDLHEGIGSAWATEFIIGLGILRLGSAVGNKRKLVLTSNGRAIFDAIKRGKYQKFSEGTDSNSIVVVKNQMKHCSSDLYDVLKSVFGQSYPFAILKQFLDEYGYSYTDRYTFMDDFFETVRKMYDKDTVQYNRDSRTPTARNRVPSLLQMCELFSLVKDSKNSLVFSAKLFSELASDRKVHSPEEIQKAVEEFDLIISLPDDLAEKYGIDGNVLRESLVRHSSLQRIFKDNLLISQHTSCIICGLSNRELLIGSHIKSSAESNAVEKADINNGLLLCCNHDKLFDRYLITFKAENGHIKISKSLPVEDLKKLGISSSYCLPQELLTEERKKYLQIHNKEFEKREEKR